MNKLTCWMWNKVLRYKLSFKRLECARWKCRARKAERKLMELRFKDD